MTVLKRYETLHGYVELQKIDNSYFVKYESSVMGDLEEFKYKEEANRWYQSSCYFLDKHTEVMEG